MAGNGQPLLVGDSFAQDTGLEQSQGSLNLNAHDTSARSTTTVLSLIESVVRKKPQVLDDTFLGSLPCSV